MNSRYAYTNNYWEGYNYQMTKSLSTKDIAKLIRERLKEEFPNCKFSVRTEVFAGGSSIYVSLVEADFDPFGDKWDDELYLPDEKINKMREHTKSSRKSGYTQLNHYYINNLCNGVFLTKKAVEVLRKVTEIANSFNYDDSDASIDYFNTRFYFHLEIGKWNKPFQIKEKIKRGGRKSKDEKLKR